MTVVYILIDALKYGLPYALLALGIFITFRVLDFADMTTEGSFTLGGTVIAVLLLRDMNPYLATFLAMICGFLAGLVTGFLHTKLKIPSLLSGIITMTALFSINMVIMGFAHDDKKYDTFLNINKVKSIYDTFLNDFMARNYSLIIISFIILVVIIILIYYFFGSEIGMSIRATGMNKSMSRAQGINTTMMIILGTGISNALIALGGALYAQTAGSASNIMGVGSLVIGLSSIILGEAIFGKKSFKNWIISVSLGAIIYYLIVALALALGLPDYYLKLLYAILIVIILVLPSLTKRIKKIRRGQVHVENQ